MPAPKRAAPLAPEARRASIIAATLPLLRRYGSSVTTAQIAMAAGVAEGTLFRAFVDKDAIICAAIENAFDPAPVERQLAAIDPDLDLRAQLIAAVEILERRIDTVWQLMTVLGRTAPPAVDAQRVRGQRAGIHGDEGIRTRLEQLFAPHAAELRCSPADGARILRMMAFAATHPRINDNQPLTAAEIVAVVLDGIRVRPELDEVI